MIICRTPFRVSFFGGGTDYPTWFEKNGGAFLSTTINRYCYVMCRRLPPFFEVKGRISWSKVENVSSIDEIENPVVRESLRFLGMEPSLDIHYHGDLPARSGLGSSSSFAVGLLNALHTLNGEAISRTDLANEAIHVERNMIGDTVGIQDQIASSFGGLNITRIRTDGTYTVQPVTLKPERYVELEDHMIMFFTGITRFASGFADSKVGSMAARDLEMRRIQSLVDEALEVLCSSTDIAEFGKLLDETWQMKRRLSSIVSTDAIDDAYAAARKHGAYGGKLLGAGGGGFMLIFAHKDRHQEIIDALPTLLHVPVQLEFQGSQTIFNDPGTRSRAMEEMRASYNAKRSAEALA